MGNDGVFTYQHKPAHMTCMCVYMQVAHLLPILSTHINTARQDIQHKKQRISSLGEKVVLISSDGVHSKDYRKQEESHRYRVNTFSLMKLCRMKNTGSMKMFWLGNCQILNKQVIVVVTTI